APVKEKTEENLFFEVSKTEKLPFHTHSNPFMVPRMVASFSGMSGEAPFVPLKKPLPVGTTIQMPGMGSGFAEYSNTDGDNPVNNMPTYCWCTPDCPHEEEPCCVPGRGWGLLCGLMTLVLFAVMMRQDAPHGR